MAKVKNRKRVSVDKIQKKRQNQSAKKPLNPFEVHINKEKLRVLGKKLKNEKGLPGISRAKAIQKRKHTLLHEYKLQNKSNKFMDKRIGERSTMSQEDKVMARFAAVRAKAHSKKNMFNLADDEVLTHRGQTLSEIEKFDDPRSDDEDNLDENETGKLDSNFVEDAHFGGGILRNTGNDGAKTHKQLIQQLIDESKKRKFENQKVKEATLELTEKLDTDWKDLVQLVSKNNKTEVDQHSEQPKLDGYDKVMRELKFEARGTVSDRLKTEDEIAREENEKLEKLEQERQERMKGFSENIAAKANHRSADDLDENCVYESDSEYMLSYDQEGQSNVPVEAEHNGKIVGDKRNEGKPQQESLESDDDENYDSDDSLADLKGNDADISDAEPETNTSESEKSPNKRKSVEPFDIKSKKVKTENVTTIINSSAYKPTDAEKIELEKAGTELPFTFKLPESYESLIETFKDQSNSHQKVILERMIKCNHPSLSQGNKEGLGLLFVYLLQYLNDLFTDIEDIKSLKKSFNILMSLMPHIYDLAQLNPENTHNSMLEVIKEKQAEYRKKKNRYPGMEVLVFFKLVSLLFSSSDFRHQVVTPCFAFIEQMLKNCLVKSIGDMSYGLYLCTLVLEYTALSKRYLPTAINYLSGILHMAIPKTSVKVIKVLPPFKSLSSNLVLLNNCSKIKPKPKLNVSTLVEKEITDESKICILYITFKLLNEFKENFKNLSSNVEIFYEVEKYVHQIPMEFYPHDIREEHKDFCDSLDKLKSERKLQYIVMEAKKPKALRLYEPKIVEVYDGKRHRVQSREKAQKAKLIHKLKKETKGALREIRRDKAFLGRVKINQRIKSDIERREKVNRIYSEAAIQQSEINALDRKNKNK